MSKKHYRNAARPEEYKPNIVEQDAIETDEVLPEDEPEHLELDIACSGIVSGIVSGCNRLNVRSEPLADAPVICTIASETEVVIDESSSTEDFYKVCLASGIEGYCTKKFITVQQ